MTRDNKGRFTSVRLIIKWFSVRFIFLFFLVSCVLAILSFSAYYTASHNAPVRIVEKTLLVQAPEELPPVLQRIAQCESGNKHTDSRGRLMINKNDDGSQDVGLFQINMKYWGLEAMKQGYNLTDEKDNIAFALWLWKTRGTEPWVHTKNCWNK